jgi:hypothetical protein
MYAGMALRLAALVLAVIAVWGGGTLLETQRRDEAVQRLLVNVASAPDGTDIDLAMAFDVEWERAILIPPYSDGGSANASLGFDQYRPEEFITPSDGLYLLIFTKARSVIAEVWLDGRAFYFDDSVKSFESDNARFHVERNDDGVVLRSLE